MASNWDSDSEPGQETDLDHQDSKLYRHLAGLVDGVRKLAITDKTSLVTLHIPVEGIERDEFLRDVTRISQPAVPCQIVLEDGEEFPKSLASDCGYSLRMRFNKLVGPARAHCH